MLSWPIGVRRPPPRTSPSQQLLLMECVEGGSPVWQSDSEEAQPEDSERSGLAPVSGAWSEMVTIFECVESIDCQTGSKSTAEVTSGDGIRSNQCVR